MKTKTKITSIQIPILEKKNVLTGKGNTEYNNTSMAFFFTNALFPLLRIKWLTFSFSASEIEALKPL